MARKEIYIEQLMLEKLSGMISEDDSSYLEDLLKSDESIRFQWEKIKEDFEGKSHHYLQNINEADAWKHVKEGIWIKKHRRKRRTQALAIAASFLLLVFAAGMFFYSHKNSARLAGVEEESNSVKLYISRSKTINLSRYKASAKLSVLNNINLKLGNGSLSYVALNNQASQALNTLVIPATKKYEITLSDGTEVTLNSASQLKFPFVFSGDKREVWLKGEAYFKVTQDKAHPFIVHTPLTEIKVLGTEFNVNTYDSLQVKTALVAGSVITQSPKGRQIRLKPGYEAVFSSAKGFKVSLFDKNNILSWMRGIYYFQNAPLKHITPVIHRWYGDIIVFDNAKASSNRFTGALLKNKPLEEFLENVALTSNIRYYDKDGVIHISTVSDR